jgi:hypothetical protein
MSLLVGIDYKWSRFWQMQHFAWLQGSDGVGDGVGKLVGGPDGVEDRMGDGVWVEE